MILTTEAWTTHPMLREATGRSLEARNLATLYVLFKL